MTGGDGAKGYAGHKVEEHADELTSSPNGCSMWQLQGSAARVHFPKGVSSQRLLLNQTSTLVASCTSEMGTPLSPTSIQQPCYGGCCMAEIGAFPLHLRPGASASTLFSMVLPEHLISTTGMPRRSSLYPAEMEYTISLPNRA